MVSHLLNTKLFIPPAHPRLVPRSRVVEAIASGIEKGHRVTLVAAPAGFGKTTAVSCWAVQSQRRIAWLSLDETDNEETLFWSYVIAAIRSAVPGFGEQALSALMTTPPAPVKSLLPELINELSVLSEGVTLVLDDYHLIQTNQIHEALSFLIAHQPQQFHLMLASRADPPIPLARLRARRQLTELRAEDLRFSARETGAFLNEVMGLGLSAEDVDLLAGRTEGWGAGILLAGQSMQGLEDRHAFVQAFSGSQRFVLEYLIEEVLDQQSEKMRAFLLQTAILDRMCAPLCNAVLGEQDSNAALQELQKNNLFLVPLDEQWFWYRYHHLFADLLKNALRQEYDEPHVLALYQRASWWYEAEGEIEPAVRFALEGKDFVRAAHLMEGIIEQMIARGQVKTLLAWLDALPEEVVQSRPRLLLHQGWVVFLSGKVRQASVILHSAKKALDSLPAGNHRDILHGRLSSLLATITALTRDLPAAVVEAQEALEKLPHEDWVFRARAKRALGVCASFAGEMQPALDHFVIAKELALRGENKFLASEILSQMATVRKHQGKLSLAWRTYEQIIGLYLHPEQSPTACLGMIGMAEIALERNQLQEAKQILDEGIALSKKGAIGYALQPAYLIGGLLQYALGDPQAALETIAKGEALSRAGGGSLESILGLAWFQTRLHLQMGDLDKARAWAEGKVLPAGWSFENMPPVQHEMHQSLLARVALYAGEWDQVLEIFDEICPQAEAEGRLARVVELNLFKAVALQEMGRKEEAQEVFENCLNLAEPEGYVRLFLEPGEVILPLLQAAEQGDHKAYVKAILKVLQGEPMDRLFVQDGLIEALTERELDVLRLMCEGDSNQKIADALVVSVNTVKKHTSNIYGKLGVKNRAQAVLRAREMGLV